VKHVRRETSTRPLSHIINLKTAKTLGLTFPITLLGRASPNGCVLSTRFTPGSEMEVLAEYFPEEGFLLPI
jgi:hypothetical protein